MNRDNIRNIVFWCILLKLFSELNSFQEKRCSRYRIKRTDIFQQYVGLTLEIFPKDEFLGPRSAFPSFARRRTKVLQYPALSWSMTTTKMGLSCTVGPPGTNQADLKRNICRCGLPRSNAAPEMLAAAGLLDQQQVFFLLKSKRTIPVFANEISRLEGYIIILLGNWTKCLFSHQ